VVAILGPLLIGATVAGSAYLGHRFELAHFHILGVIPFGALLIGAAATIGVVLTIWLTSNYDTSNFRLAGQIGGAAAYCAVIFLDFLGTPARAGVVGAARVLGFEHYLAAIADQEAQAIIAFLPSFLQLPPGLQIWTGIVALLVEILGAAVATGWTISVLTGVPFCVTNRRFYSLKGIAESGDLDGLAEWERAIAEHRPIEGRAIFARFHMAGVKPGTREWVRVAVHQCPVCLSSRVRIEPRHRIVGLVRTGRGRDLTLDARGSAAIPD